MPTLEQLIVRRKHWPPEDVEALAEEMMHREDGDRLLDHDIAFALGLAWQAPGVTYAVGDSGDSELLYQDVPWTTDVGAAWSLRKMLLPLSGCRLVEHHTMPDMCSATVFPEDGPLGFRSGRCQTAALAICAALMRVVAMRIRRAVEDREDA